MCFVLFYVVSVFGRNKWFVNEGWTSVRVYLLFLFIYGSIKCGNDDHLTPSNYQVLRRSDTYVESRVAQTWKWGYGWNMWKWTLIYTYIHKQYILYKFRTWEYEVFKQNLYYKLDFFFLCMFVYKIIAISTRSTMSCNHVKTNKCISNNLGFIIEMHLLVFRKL